jgi:signal peptidase I
MAKRKYKYMSKPDERLMKRKRLMKELLIWVIEILLVLGAAYYISFHLLEKTAVIGDSMSPTLEDGEKILINCFSYRFHDPERFDVIVYKQSNKEHSYYDVKRVIGLPGETVRIDEEGAIWIDGERIEEKVAVDRINNAGLARDEGVLLDEKEYFVLGDNRNESEDSRFANVGNVVRSDIIGKAWIRLEPFNFISTLNVKADKTEEGKEQEIDS